MLYFFIRWLTAEPSLKISHATIVPFAKAFPLELHGEIALYLPRGSLKSYSLASRVLNMEANRVLWRSVAVTALHAADGSIEEFVNALLRDPVRAAKIRRITFQPRCSYRDLSIFPPQPTEAFWEALKEALNLLVHTNIVVLLAFISFDLANEDYPDRFIDIIGSVFQRIGVPRLQADLPQRVLFRLWRLWPSLTDLYVHVVFEESPIYLPPDALPQLRHVELGVDLMRQVVLGRSIETITQYGGPINMHPNNVNRLRAIFQDCNTLRQARVTFHTSCKDEFAKLLPALAHDNLRDLGVTIQLTYKLQPNPPPTVQALPPGALKYFPKLEFLQMSINHSSFFDWDGGDTREDYDAVAKALSGFLTLENHGTLVRVKINVQSWDVGLQGTHLIATRSGSHWDVEVAKISALGLRDLLFP